MAKNNNIQTFTDLDALAKYLRKQMRERKKKAILIFAYNGTGKTRLSMAFKDLGKHGDQRDTLYFNAFTEDLFTWDNDLENDSERVLRMNTASRFFDGLAELEMESRIRKFLHRYADFNFDIDYGAGRIRFWRETQKNAEERTSQFSSRSPAARKTSLPGVSFLQSPNWPSTGRRLITGCNTSTLTTPSHPSMKTTPSPWLPIWRK